jgi:hypothetical protein
LIIINGPIYRKCIEDKKCVVLGLQSTGEAKLLKNLGEKQVEGLESTAGYYMTMENLNFVLVKKIV